MALAAGSKAPDFKLQATPDQAVSLQDFRGKPIILAFYPADWSPVCGDQMALYNEVLSEFRKFGADIVGISVDGVWCHLAFSKDRQGQLDGRPQRGARDAGRGRGPSGWGTRP